MNKYLQLGILIFIAAAALFLLPRKHVTDVNNTTMDQQDEEDFQQELILDQPKYLDLVTSPMKISGKVKGDWFFEGTMPVVLKDSNGKVLVEQPIHATGDWMTADYVPFEMSLSFPTPDTDFGVLIISKDNPSGDPGRNSSFAIQVKFR
jgi:hypothetical protein